MFCYFYSAAHNLYQLAVKHKKMEWEIYSAIVLLDTGLKAIRHFYSFACMTATLYSLAFRIFLPKSKKEFRFFDTRTAFINKEWNIKNQHKQERYGNSLTGWIAKMLFDN